MKKLITLLLAALLICYAQLINAQVTIEAQSADVCKYSTVSIDVSATDFENMVSAQFAIFWDETVLDYSGVTAYAPFSYPTHFEESFVTNGELRFIWFDPTFPPGQTVPDGNPIFTINFDVIGDYGMMSNITFGPSPPFFIVDLQSTSGAVALNPIDGQVTIDDEDPVISGCPPALVNVIAPFDSTTTYSYDWTAPTATDICGLVSFDSSHASGAQLFPVGMTTAVTYVATDSAGNSATCMFNVNVLAGANPNALTFSVESDIDSIVLDTAFLKCGDPFTVALTVQNFEDMLSAQFGVAWDETVIQLNNFTDIVNASHPTATYIDNYASEGQFRYGWIDSGLDGEDIPDGDTLFLLHFTVLNPLSSPTAINIEGFPFDPGPPVIPPFPLEVESAVTGTIPNNTINFEGLNLVLVPNEAPVLASCNDREVIADADCSVPLPDYRNLVSATDVCTDSTSLILTQTPSAGTAVTADVMVSIVAEDAEGLKDTCTFLVVFTDNQPPIPTTPSLPNATGQCSVTVAAPTANDNCAGVVTATTSDPLTYNTQGTFTINWTYNDGNGNSATQMQTVIVDDTANPVPDVANLPNATGECSVTVTAPTATDNCAGAITATTADPTTYNSQGTFTITWTYNDGNGNSATQMQTVIVDDVTAPVPNVANLPAITGECSAAVAVAPTATDNCAGVVTATTTDPLTYNAQGTFTITWTYSDGNGNTSTQTQTVIVDDVTAPVPNVDPLPTVTDDCGATLTAPTATDNCAGTVTATTTDPTTYNTTGTYMVTWTYNDGNGNTSSQTQTVVISDMTAPVPNVANLPNATGQCSVTVTAPTATDNCAGTVTGTTSDPLTYNTQGTFTITWTYNDGNGNTATQTQTVIVDDVTAPVPTVPVLPIVTDQCSVTLIVPSANDNCAGVILGTTTDPMMYNTQGTFMVTWTYNDGNGNISTQTQTVIVDDVTAPVPNVANLPTITGECAATATAPTATDNCAGTVTATTTDPTTYNTQGTFTINWVYNDGNGNTSTQAQTVIVDDVTAPVPNVATLPTINAQCDTTVTPPTATDNCAGNLTASTSDPLTYNAQGTFTITWTYDDGNGNTATQTQNVVIDDTQGPVITGCPANIVQNNDPDECSALVTWVEPTATDNCADTITLSNSHDPNTVFPVGGPTLVTYTFTDEVGNASVCSFEVTVNDTQDPMATCPPNQVEDLDANCDAVLDNYISLGTYSDNCTALQNLDFVQFPDSGTVITATEFVSVTITDEAGNSRVCNFQVSVGTDVTPPAIVCPANIAVGNTLDSCHATVTWAMPTVTDNCDANPTITCTPPSGTVFPIGDSTVVCIAEDANGNLDTCTFVVTVSDTQAPEFTSCPGNISLTAPQGQCSATATWASPTATDNCDSAPTITCSHVSGASFPVGSTMVMCIAEDAAGNLDTCSFSVNVVDNEDPTLTCPSDLVVIVPIGTTDTLLSGLGLTSFDDNCGIDTIFYILTGVTTGTGSGSVVNSTSFNLDTTLVTFIIIDDSGNSDTCSFEVVVEEETLIEIGCPMDLVFNNTPGQCNTAVFSGLAPVIMPANILDNYGYTLSGATIGSGSNSADGETFNVGTTTITYAAISIYNDTATCSFTVQVNDNEAPMLSNCPSGTVTVNNATGLCGTNFIGNLVPLATDNCPGMIINYSPALGSLIPVGTNTITATAQDASGNTTICSYTLIVNDTEAPLISGCSTLVNNPIIVDAAPGLCSAIVTWVEPTATDNCNLLAFTSSQGPGTSFNVGVTPVEYVAVDAIGNVSKCQFNVTVVDNQAPVFTGCPGNINVSNTPGECSAVVTWPQIIVNDNCGVVAFSCSEVSGTTFPVGNHQVSCSAVDAAGNTTVCAFNITVNDNELPNIFNVPGDITVASDPDTCGATLTWQDPLAADNCGIETFSSTHAPGDFFPVGQTDVQYVAIDDNGNVRILEFTITVADSTLPVFTCPGNVTLTAAGELVSGPADLITNFESIDCEKIRLEFDTPVATDNCGISSVVQTEGTVSGQIFGVGANTVTFVATDVNGNLSSCSFEITVQSVDDAVAGAFLETPCEGDDVFFFVNEYPNATYTWTNPAGDTISDQPSFLYPSLEVGESGTYKVVVDLPFNCSRQALVDITVVPNPNPGITYNDLLCTDGSQPLNLMAVDSANAGVTSWVWELPDGSFVFGQNITVNNATSADSGPYTVTAINANGCEGTATVNVSILDEPMMPALFGTATTACVGGAPIVLNGQQLNGTSVEYIWTADPQAGSGLIAINNNIVSVNPTAPGIYRYYFQVLVDGCASDVAEWVINVEAPPALSIVVNGETDCVSGNNFIVLTDTMGAATQWSWSGPCIAGTASGSSVELQNATANCSGIYTVVGTTNNGCVNQSSIQLNITNQPPDPTLTPSALSICTGSEVLIVANPNYGQTAQFLWTGENLPPNAPSVQSIEVALTTPGLYAYTFAAVVNGCTTSIDTIEILVEDAPPVDVTLVGNVACVDGTGTITLQSNAPNAVSWVWTNSAGTVLSMEQDLVLNNVTAAQSGSYFVEAQSAIGCTSFGFYELTITDELPPVEATLEQTACEDGDLEFSATFIPGAAYEWRNPANGIFSTTPNPTIFGATADQNGTYTVTVSLNGCTSSDDTTVTVALAPIANGEEVVGLVNTPQSFNVVVNDVLASNNYTITVVDQPDNGSVRYDGAGVLTYTPNNGFRETDMLAYQICYDECPDLCDVALVTLYIRFPGDTCVITTVITPNGDGVNDEFVVSCLEAPFGAKPNNELVIFNQWGDKVYEAAPYKNDWQGTWNGRDLPDGTYFYIFNPGPGEEPQKGFVMIYR